MIEKRYIILLLVLFCALTVLSGCQDEVTEEVPDKGITIYATVFPVYVITQEIVDGVPDVSLHCLVQPQNGPFREYSLSDWDMALLSGADAVVMGGNSLESFAQQFESMGESAPALLSVMTSSEAEKSGAYLTIDAIEEMSAATAEGLAILDPRYTERFMENRTKLIEKLSDTRIAVETIREAVRGNDIILLCSDLEALADAYELSVQIKWERHCGDSADEAEIDSMLDELARYNCGCVMIDEECPKIMADSLERNGYKLIRIDTMTDGRPDEGFEGYAERLMKNAIRIKEAFRTKEER